MQGGPQTPSVQVEPEPHRGPTSAQHYSQCVLCWTAPAYPTSTPLGAAKWRTPTTQLRVARRPRFICPPRPSVTILACADAANQDAAPSPQDNPTDTGRDNDYPLTPGRSTPPRSSAASRHLTTRNRDKDAYSEFSSLLGEDRKENSTNLLDDRAPPSPRPTRETNPADYAEMDAFLKQSTQSPASSQRVNPRYATPPQHRPNTTASSSVGGRADQSPTDAPPADAPQAALTDNEKADGYALMGQLFGKAGKRSASARKKSPVDSRQPRAPESGSQHASSPPKPPPRAEPLQPKPQRNLTDVDATATSPSPELKPPPVPGNLAPLTAEEKASAYNFMNETFGSGLGKSANYTSSPAPRTPPVSQPTPYKQPEPVPELLPKPFAPQHFKSPDPKPEDTGPSVMDILNGKVKKNKLDGPLPDLIAKPSRPTPDARTEDTAQDANATQPAVPHDAKDVPVPVLQPKPKSPNQVRSDANASMTDVTDVSDEPSPFEIITRKPQTVPPDELPNLAAPPTRVSPDAESTVDVSASSTVLDGRPEAPDLARTTAPDALESEAAGAEPKRDFDDNALPVLPEPVLASPPTPSVHAPNTDESTRREGPASAAPAQAPPPEVPTLTPPPARPTTATAPASGDPDSTPYADAQAAKRQATAQWFADLKTLELTSPLFIRRVPRVIDPEFQAHAGRSAEAESGMVEASVSADDVFADVAQKFVQREELDTTTVEDQAGKVPASDADSPQKTA